MSLGVDRNLQNAINDHSYQDRKGDMRRSILTLLSVFALAIAVLAPVGAAGAAEITTDTLTVPQAEVDAIKTAKVQTYIVQMLGAPVVAYEGDVKGIPATKPRPGKKIDPNSAKVTKYVDHLKRTQDELLASVGASAVYNYVYTYNGFAAELDGVQASAIANNPEVISIVVNEVRQPDTSTTPTFLGLDADGGAWDQLGGVGNAGEGVIVGIIDTGIWPENPSFSDRTGTNPNGKEGKLDYKQIPGWHGKCTPGEDFPASDCNQKLIGAQWFNAGYGGDAGVKALFPFEFASARDADGHGSHTASTAAGNNGVEVVIEGQDFGAISGMAPRARISMYKVCWGSDQGGCSTVDSVAAIDQAVADGVDVLNYSISGSLTSSLDPVEVAFLFAADAGVFVAVSAGNSGPGASTVAHNSPWLTTVAAGTHDRFYAGTADLGDGTSYDGAMLDAGPVTSDLVYAADVAAAGVDPADAALCFENTLDDAEVAGKIVVCDRGTIARVDKSAEVARAGGIGMIHANVSPSSINADIHAVPTLHVDDIDGATIRGYAQTPGATATIQGGALETAIAPAVAAFSSRGPALAAGGDILKPDIMAPGVDILAAVSPVGYDGRDFDLLSGTSMSSPHMAGIGALMKQEHPDWSAMMIKSALMTTASQTTNEGTPISGNPFGYGAGQVVPTAALDPGLVYDAGWNDWLGFLCGTGELQAGFCSIVEIDPSDLNYPSISIGQLAGSQTVMRTVTNVGPAATYDVTVDAPAGVDVEVNPTSLTLAKGASAEYEVTFTTTTGATLNQAAFGSLTWAHGPHSVRSPLVVTPVAIAAPGEVSGTGTDGSLGFDVTFGFAGDYEALPQGLVAADTQEGNVVDDPANDINTALATGVGVTFHAVEIGPGESHARFSLFDEYTDGNDDLDLYVFDPGFGFAGGSGSGTSEEEVNVASPVAGTWTVVVHGWQTDGPDSNYTLFSWAFGADEGNMTITGPASAVLGATEPFTVDWTALLPDTKYLGGVSFTDTSTEVGFTFVSIDS